jgi:hypothetical protein
VPAFEKALEDPDVKFFECTHPYDNNADIYEPVHIEGAARLEVTVGAADQSLWFVMSE